MVTRTMYLSNPYLCGPSHGDSYHVHYTYGEAWGDAGDTGVLLRQPGVYYLGFPGWPANSSLHYQKGKSAPICMEI